MHVSLGGSQIRVRFSNEFGNGPVTINAAHVAVCKANPVNSTIDTTTDKALAFSGTASVTIAQGQAVWSDAVDFTLAALSNLTVTVAFGSVPSNVTGHPGSRTTSYQQTGSSNVSAASMSSAHDGRSLVHPLRRRRHGRRAAKGIVVLGDSITDGRGSTTNGNDRWPDDLARRLQANARDGEGRRHEPGHRRQRRHERRPRADRRRARYIRDVLGQSGVR